MRRRDTFPLSFVSRFLIFPYLHYTRHTNILKFVGMLLVYQCPNPSKRLVEVWLQRISRKPTAQRQPPVEPLGFSPPRHSHILKNVGMFILNPPPPNFMSAKPARHLSKLMVPDTFSYSPFPLPKFYDVEVWPQQISLYPTYQHSQVCWYVIGVSMP